MATTDQSGDRRAQLLAIEVVRLKRELAEALSLVAALRVNCEARADVITHLARQLRDERE